jgi:DNA-binding CsgD family transcriptional regulator
MTHPYCDLLEMNNTANELDAVTLSGILEKLYAVPMGLTSWQTALESYAVLFPAVSMALVGYEGRLNDAGVMAYANFDGAFIRSYTEYYYSLNPWTDLLLRAPLAPELTWGHDFVSQGDLERTEFYADWVRPQGDISTGFASALARDRDRFFLLATNVSPEFLPEAKRAAQAFKLIGPHMRRSLELWRRLEGRSFNHAASLEILDRLSSGVFVVDPSLRILFENRRARELAREGQALAVSTDQRLKFNPHHNQVAVESHFAAVRSLVPQPQPLLLHLRQASGKSSAVFIAPIAREMTVGDGPTRCYMVFVIDLSNEPLIETEMLSTALRITQAEALLARALFADKTLADYAEERQVSKHTARAQLKSLMHKTETKRQSELVKLLTRMLTTMHLKNDDPS